MTSPKACPFMNLIVAVAGSNYAIGRSGTLPWRLRADFKHFVRLTSKTTDEIKLNAVIMGRNCYESIPAKFRPLKNRVNIILSRTMPKEHTENKDLHVCRSLEEIGELVEELGDSIETVWNLGGREIYDLGLRENLVKRMFVTKIHQEIEGCDTFFPKIDWNQWKEISVPGINSDIQEENDLKFSFHVYEKLPWIWYRYTL